MIHPFDIVPVAPAIHAPARALSAAACVRHAGLSATWRRDPDSGRPVMRWSPDPAPRVVVPDPEPIDALIASVLARHRSLRAA